MFYWSFSPLVHFWPPRIFNPGYAYAPNGRPKRTVKELIDTYTYILAILLTRQLCLFDGCERVLLYKQAVGGRAGGRHYMPPPRPATEARSGSLEPRRPRMARSANTRHPAGLPHTPPTDRMYATDIRQTSDRQTSDSIIA